MDGESAGSLPIPPTLRLLELPRTRCACLDLPGPQRIHDTLVTLLAALPEMGEHYNGDPVRLVRSESALTLQLPLLDGEETPR